MHIGTFALNGARLVHALQHRYSLVLRNSACAKTLERALATTESDPSARSLLRERKVSLLQSCPQLTKRTWPNTGQHRDISFPPFRKLIQALDSSFMERSSSRYRDASKVGHVLKRDGFQSDRPQTSLILRRTTHLAPASIYGPTVVLGRFLRAARRSKYAKRKPATLAPAAIPAASIVATVNWLSL